MKSMRDPQGDREAGQRDLAEQLDARPQVEQVVDRAEPGRDRPTEQQRRHLRWREGELGPARNAHSG